MDIISTKDSIHYPRNRSDAPGDVLNIAVVKNLWHEVDVTVVDEFHFDHLPVKMPLGNDLNEPTLDTITTMNWMKFVEHIRGKFGEFNTNF